MRKTVEVAWTFSFSTAVEIEVDAEDCSSQGEIEDLAMREGDRQLRRISLDEVLVLCNSDGKRSANEFEVTDVYED